MHRTMRTARRAGALGLATLALAALAACAGPGTVTVDPTEGPSERTTEPATSQARTTEPVRTTAPPTTTEAATTQQATDGDLEPAKQAVVDFYTKASEGDFAGACHHVFNIRTKVGLVEGEAMHGGCVSGLESNRDTYARIKGHVSIDKVSASLQPDGSVSITIGDSDEDLKVSKGADGAMYLNLLG